MLLSPSPLSLATIVNPPGPSPAGIIARHVHTISRLFQGFTMQPGFPLRDKPTRGARLEAASQSVSSARREKCPRLPSESLWLPIVSRRSLGSPLSGGDTSQPSIDANSPARACINFIKFSHH